MTKERLWLPALVLAATAYTGARIQGPPATPSSISPRPGRPECPHDWDFKAGQAAAVGPTINVPEFNDCQRFIVYTDTGRVYDSLYAIFASRGLDTLDTALAVLDSGHSGKVALVAAEVYAEGVYRALGITSTFNCLYLYRDVRTAWRAKMVPVGRAEVDCSQPIDPTNTQGMELRVVPEHLRGFAESDFPAVARWDLDTLHHVQYIGIKCGADWCDVGPSIFAPTNPQKGSTTVGRRTTTIKGWYDEQPLADTAPGGYVRPSGLWGRIYPDMRLDSYRVQDFAKRWLHVADVALENRSGLANPHNLYKQRFNFDITQPGGRLNAIFMCHGTNADCGVPLTLTCDGDGLWWARVVEATSGDGRPPRFMCEERRAHNGLGIHVPGTARWRWLASDETTWKRCDNGCCELK